MNWRVFNTTFDVVTKDILIKLGIITNKCINGPYQVIFVITNKCNARCEICNLWKSNGSKEDLSIDEWKRIIGELYEWTGTFNLTITGGEPFIHKNILELLGYSKSYNIHTNVCTNGIMFEGEYINKILDTGVDRITFSLNSINPQIHDKYKGVEGIHKKVVSSIKYIKRKKSRVSISVQFVVTKDNYRRNLHISHTKSELTVLIFIQSGILSGMMLGCHGK